MNIIRLDTRYGTLIVPRAECIRCIAEWRFFTCTACEFTMSMMADAEKLFPHGSTSVEDFIRLKGIEQNMSEEEINKIIKESLLSLDETRSE